MGANPSVAQPSPSLDPPLGLGSFATGHQITTFTFTLRESANGQGAHWKRSSVKEATNRLTSLERPLPQRPFPIFPYRGSGIM